MYSKLVTNLRRVNTVYLRIQSCSYSSPPKKKQVVDPFGLAEEINRDEAGIHEMIQGIYITPPRSRPPKDEDSSPERAPDGNFAPHSNATEGLNSNKQDRNDTIDAYESFKQKHGHWLKSKAARVIEKDFTAEKVRNPHFGEVRLDSENVTTIDGQFDETFFDPEEANYISESKFKRLAKQSKDIQNPAKLRIDEGLTNMKIVGKGIKIQTNEPGQRIQSHLKNQNSSNVQPSTSESAGIQISSLKKQNQSQSVGADQVAGAPAASSIKTPNRKETKEKLEDKEDPLSTTPKTALQYLKLKKMKESLDQAKIMVKMGGGREAEIDKSSIHEVAKQHIPAVYDRLDFQDVPHDDVWYYIQKNICFHNTFLIAINKPYGFPMHTATVDCRHTIIDFLPELAHFAKVKQVFPCHRLDKDTTGVLLLAKSEEAAAAIKHKFANRTIKKAYLAITKNCPEIPEGTIKIPIGEGKMPQSNVYRAVLKPDLQKFNITAMQKDCKDAVTRFKVVKSQPWGALLEVYPETGLTHQIRVHLAQGLGCPILGDHKYSHRSKMAPQRLHDEVLDRLKVKQSKVRHLPVHLHSSKVEFTMPDGFMNKKWDEPVFVHARPPKFFLHTMRALGLKNN